MYMNDRTEHSGVWPVVANKRNRKSCSSATFGDGTPGTAPAIASVVAQNAESCWGSAAPGGGFAIICSISIQMPQSSTASRGGASPSLECVLREFVLDRGGGGGASRMHSSSSSSRSQAWLVSSFPRRGLRFSHCVRSII